MRSTTQLNQDLIVQCVNIARKSDAKIVQKYILLTHNVGTSILVGQKPGSKKRYIFDVQHLSIIIHTLNKHMHAHTHLKKSLTKQTGSQRTLPAYIWHRHM